MPMDTSLQDSSIPLLTEVIEAQPPADASAKAPSARAPAPTPAPGMPATVPTTVPTPLQTAQPDPGQLSQPAPPVARTSQSPASAPPDARPEGLLVRLSEQEMEQLQNKLSERVLRQLQGRIDFVLEQRVRDSLADVLQLAMGGLTNDIKRGLQHTLEEVVGRAVAQEIARLQSGKK